MRGRGSLLQPPGGVSLRSTPPVQACLRQETHYNITSFGHRDNLTNSVSDPTMADNFGRQLRARAEQQVVQHYGSLTTMIDKTSIREQLLKEGANEFTGITLRSVSVQRKDEDHQPYLCCSTDVNTPRYKRNDKGDYEYVEDNLLVLDIFNVIANLREIEEVAPIANYIKPNGDDDSAFVLLEQILINSKVDTIIVEFHPGEDDKGQALRYENPYSSRESTEKDVVKHDDTKNFVQKIKLGKTGLQFVEDFKATLRQRIIENILKKK